jgi:hypothetical protein
MVLMVGSVTVNLDVVEAMLYYWQSTKDRIKMSDLFILDVAAMPGLQCAYDDEFNAESVRRALSAIVNREAFSSNNRKEGRFYSNNLWMLEDLGLTERMVTPLKKLNLSSLPEKLNELQSNGKYQELAVIFSPLHIDEYIIKNSRLIINFFAVRPGDEDDRVYIGDQELLAFVVEKLVKLLADSSDLQLNNCSSR